MGVVCRSISQQFDMRVSSEWTARVGDTTTGLRRRRSIPTLWPEIARLPPGTAGMAHNDARLLVPFAAFAGVEHPGPGIVICQRACRN